MSPVNLPTDSITTDGHHVEVYGVFVSGILTVMRVQRRKTQKRKRFNIKNDYVSVIVVLFFFPSILFLVLVLIEAVASCVHVGLCPRSSAPLCA